MAQLLTPRFSILNSPFATSGIPTPNEPTGLAPRLPEEGWHPEDDGVEGEPEPAPQPPDVPNPYPVTDPIPDQPAPQPVQDPPPDPEELPPRIF